MGQWLRAIGGYTVEQIGLLPRNLFWWLAHWGLLDYYPSGVTAVAIVSTLTCATWTDHTQVRWPVLIYMSVCCIIAGVCILASKSTGLRFFAYCKSVFNLFII